MGLICQLLYLYSFVLFARIILSWVTMFWSPPSYLSAGIRVIYDLTEPVLGFVRRYIPPVGGLDLSPLVVFIGIQLICSALV
ncbi:MAG: YggT family protein [Actinomycetota bacterium]